LNRQTPPTGMLFYTTDLIEAVIIRHRTGETWEEMWRYLFTHSIHDDPPPPAPYNQCDNDCVVSELTAIVRKEANGATWPAVTFDYRPEEMGNWPPDEECDLDCSQQTKYVYPLLEVVDNGYGGAY